MRWLPRSRRWLSAALAAAVCGALGVVISGADRASGKQIAGFKSRPGDWAMFGGSPARNMVNDHAEGLPIKWTDEDGSILNLKWAAELGTRAYGGPIVAGGQVYVGTNNQTPRDPNWVKDGEPID